MPNIYNFILQGHEATLKNAILHAKGQDWSSIELRKANSARGPHSYFEQTVNGIDIYYNVVADYYYFVEEEEE